MKLSEPRDKSILVDLDIEEWTGLERLIFDWDDPFWILRIMPSQIIQDRKRIIELLRVEFAQLEAENEALRGRILHDETFDSELPNSGYSVIDFDAGVTRTWDSLTDLQKKHWIGLASLREKT